ncbi:LLM class flavin-dependent oxidoreductase [Catenulispora rubra]|uniref:LLM class flavin-dependent oxidoreductase n=1 Tax=Catenulispora rubra TaxID=280293 RepID=UPI0018925CB3|nr:LLM class flavin-dependent oxidoreductase [Catenulispora rubra]
MNAPRLGLRLPPCASARDVAAVARKAERAGFDTVWIPDSQFLFRDVWMTATMVADRTETIGIGIAVTNFTTRHVAVTANAACSVDELSGGRVRIAVGTGDSAVKTLGHRPMALARMREQIGLLRALVRGEEVTWPGQSPYAGRPIRLRHATGRDIPVYMAATGPKALALAGEVADGVIVAAGVAPPLVERALSFVRSGAERAGRRLEDLDVWLAAHTALTLDESAAARLVKPLCLAMAQLGAGHALRAVGIDLDVPPVIAGIEPDVTHAQSWEEAMAIADDYITPDAAARFAENLTLAGPAQAVADRVQAATACGVRAFYLLAPVSDELPHDLIDGFARTLIPRRSPRMPNTEMSNIEMSNTEIVFGMYAAFLRGDYDALYNALDPDIEWVEPELEVLPYPGLTAGREQVATKVFPEIATTYEKLEFHPDQFIPGEGDVVTVLGTGFAKGPRQPEESFSFCHVMRLREGRVYRFDHYVDTYKIARTLTPPQD